MAYLVRKLNKRESMDIIGAATNIQDMFADAATTEFRTKNGTLSTWRIDDISELDEAILAIVVTSSKVERMDFVIINTDYLDENNLKYNQSYAGQDIAVPDLQDTHYDIINITIPNLIKCTCVYRKVFEADNDKEMYIVRYVEGDIKELLKKANSENRIDLEKLNKGIKKELISA